MTLIRTLAPLALGLACIVPIAAAAEAQLASQRIDGAWRVCVYQTSRIPARVASVRRGGAVIERRIGRGEPCPGHDPGPPRSTANNAIPPYARLVGDRTVGARRFCVYEYLGAFYNRPVGNVGQCPSTPSFR